MSRKSAKPQVGVALFPFLAVLICTMGALIVLLVLLVQQARVDASTIAARQIDSGSAAAAEAALQDRLDQAQWRREVLEKSRTEKADELTQSRARLAHLEEHIQRLEEQARQLLDRARSIDEGKQLRDDELAAARAEADRLQDDINRKRSELAERKKGGGKPDSYALIPYDGPAGTRRRPIYIECTASGVIIQPEGLVLKAEDFSGPMGPGNPLDTALRAIREYTERTASNQAGLAYPLIVVRPGGIVAYGAARTAMRSWDEEFGYELISDDKQLDFGPPDPALSQVLNKSVTVARQRQAMMAAMMPRQYQTNEPLQSFAAESSSTVTPASAAGSGLGFGGRGVSAPGGFAPGGMAAAGAGGPGLPGGGTAGSGPGRGGVGGQRGGSGATGNPAGLPGTVAASGNRGGSGGMTGQRGGAGGLPSGAGGSPATFGQDFMNRGSGSGGSGSGSGGDGFASGGAAASGSGKPGSSTAFGQPANGALPGGGYGSATGAAGTGGSYATGGAAGGQPGGTAASGSAGGMSGSALGSSGSPGGSSLGGGSSAGMMGSPGTTPAPDLNFGFGDKKPASSGGSSPSGGSSASGGGARGGSRSGKGRGKDWALLNVKPHTVGVTRPIHIQMMGDSIVILPDRGDSRPPLMVRLSRELTPEDVSRFVAAVQNEVKGWGLAVSDGYWKPILQAEVAPDAERHFSNLKTALDGSGLEMVRK